MPISQVPPGALRRWCIVVLSSLVLLLTLESALHAEPPPILPEPTLPPSGNPLCTSNVIQCFDIDDLAGHVWGHL